MNTVHLEAKGSNLQLARELGGQLKSIKALCGKGEWLKTLKKKTTISPRQAQKYIRIFTHWKLLPIDNSFTIDQAYDYIGELLV